MESRAMLPDCEARLERARQELSKLIITVDTTAVDPELLSEARSLV